MGCLTAPSDGSIGQAIKRPSVTELRVVTHHPLNPFWGVKIQQSKQSSINRYIDKQIEVITVTSINK